MLRITLAGLRAHKLRTLLTGIAIMIGVSFLAGTLIYGDTAKAAFYDDLARPGVGVDVAVIDDFGFGRDRTVDAALLERVRGLPGVAQADGRVVANLAMLDRNGRVLSNEGRVGYATSVPTTPGMSMFRTVAGRPPGGAGEAALDEPTAARQRITIGDTVTVLDSEGEPRQLQVVGLTDFGATPVFKGWSVLTLSAPDLGTLTDASGYASVVIAAVPGTDPADLRSTVSAAVGAEHRVITGERFRAELAEGSAKYVEGFLITLLASAIVALVVACLVVYNTFTILVAQRSRELALLRCVGTSRRQIFGLVIGEAVLVGLLASAGGVLFSAVVGRVMLVGRDVVGGGVPDHPLVIAPGTVVVALVVGTVTTVASGVLPAMAAGRVAPLAALREATSSEPDVHNARRRMISRTIRGAAAIALALGGLALTGLGLGRGFAGTPAVLGGAMVVFVAIVIALPLVVARLARIVGWLPTRLLGVTGSLAAANAQRNPRRFAATTTALMIGIALMSLFTVVLSTAREQADLEIAENFPFDFVLDGVSVTRGQDVLPDALVAGLRQRSEFDTVARTRIDAAFIDGDRTTVSAIEPPAASDSVPPGDGARPDGLEPEITDGRLADLAAGTVALRRAFADDAGLGVGDTVRVDDFDDRGWDARVVALYDDAPVDGDVLMDWSDFAVHFGHRGDQVLIRRASGVNAAAAGAALDEVLIQYPLVAVTSQAERREALTAELDKRLIQFGGLLGMSTLIAILGIMDTLALSVLERTRESATLRALGLGRRQLRVMLLVEALLMALVGALIGVAFGLVFGWLTAFELIDAYGRGAPSVPVLQLAGYVTLAALAGMLASVLPARRAARASVVSAMADT